MSIADQITRIKNAKLAIKEAIKNKGVNVSDTAKLDEYASLIDSIEVGNGGADDGDGISLDDWLKIRTNDYKYFAYLFYGCNATSLDVSNFDTSQATNMSRMFHMCNRLTSLDVSNFNTSNVTDMSNMFYNCNSLKTLDVSNFNTSNVTNMNNMFYNCYDLKTLDVSNWDTSNVTDIGNMFYYCSSLTSLDVNNWDTSKVTTMGYAFQRCTGLTSLDLSNWDGSKVTSSSGFRLFGASTNDMPQLTDFKAPKNIGANFDVSQCPNLTHDSLMSIINNLVQVSSSKTLTLGATNLAKLSDEEKAIATNKGWTLK